MIGHHASRTGVFHPAEITLLQTTFDRICTQRKIPKESPAAEHLVPGRGRQPCAELLRGIAATGYRGMVVAEGKTTRAANISAITRPTRRPEPVTKATHDEGFMPPLSTTAATTTRQYHVDGMPSLI